MQPAESVFLSPYWLQACLSLWSGRAKYRIHELVSKDGASSWAVLGQRTEVRHRILPVRVLALNQSTVEILDQPWIEHNGFFGGRAQRFSEDLVALLEDLSSDPHWDELRLGGLVEARAHEALYLAARFGLSCHIEHEHLSFCVDLEQIRRTHSGDYLSALSANTRQQLRRSKRLAERILGDIRLDVARSADQAWNWFRSTAPFHQSRWNRGGDATPSSGFSNPHFVEFHRLLIEQSFESGSVQYLRLCAGEKSIAFLYNFVAGRNVQFYLSGIDYEIDTRVRPGLLAHWMAIEHNLHHGMDTYDFLAGDARYKRNLATREGKTLWLVVQRPRWRLQFERFGREAKRRLIGGELPRDPEE